MVGSMLANSSHCRNSSILRLIREPIINLKQIDNKHKRDEYIKLIEELFDI